MLTREHLQFILEKLDELESQAVQTIGKIKTDFNDSRAVSVISHIKEAQGFVKGLLTMIPKEKTK